MKRILSLALALLLLAGLCGCMAPPEAQQTYDLPILTPGQETAAPGPGETETPTAEAPAQTQTPEAPATEAAAETEAVPETEAATAVPETEAAPGKAPALTVTEDGVYDSKEEVALYLHLYGHLPSNYITKRQAEALGWPGGYLEPYAPGKCIGGSHFGNYEGLLPDAKGRTWTECDIDTLGKRSRGAKRIIFSNDGLIYYTDNHYESFTLLYGEGD